MKSRLEQHTLIYSVDTEDHKSDDFDLSYLSTLSLLPLCDRRDPVSSTLLLLHHPLLQPLSLLIANLLLIDLLRTLPFPLFLQWFGRPYTHRHIRLVAFGFHGSLDLFLGVFPSGVSGFDSIPNFSP